MPPLDASLVRRLTRGLYASPDPALWLVLADHYEECGQDDEATKWRRRALLFEVMLRAMRRVVADPFGSVVVFRRLDGSVGFSAVVLDPVEVLFRFRRTTKSVHYAVGDVFPPATKSHLFSAVKGDPAYYVRKAIELIDRLPHPTERST